jgi:hypothetical protein
MKKKVVFNRNEHKIVKYQGVHLRQSFNHWSHHEHDESELLTYVSSVGTQSIRQKEEELGFLEQCCEQ